MFTGIVERKLPVASLSRSESGLEFELDLSSLSEGLGLGDSVAVNGCCLTVAELRGSLARFHAGRETLELTNLGALATGTLVNVERALRFGDQLGGHLVSGHVDGLGSVHAIEPEPSQTVMTFSLPSGLMNQVILKGSITLDGISLTITEVIANRVSVALIPHTLEVTTLGLRRVGDPINVETDMVGKWILKQAMPVTDELLAILKTHKGTTP